MYWPGVQHLACMLLVSWSYLNYHLKPYNENRLAWTIAPYSFYRSLCDSPVENCQDKKFKMYLNRFDDNQLGFGHFTDWFFICESEIGLVKLGFQNCTHQVAYLGNSIWKRDSVKQFKPIEVQKFWCMDQKWKFSTCREFLQAA